jgi:hypothetical protein
VFLIKHFTNGSLVKKSIVPVEIVGMTENQPLKEVQKQKDPSCQEPIGKSLIQGLVISQKNSVQISKTKLSY